MLIEQISEKEYSNALMKEAEKHKFPTKKRKL